MTIGVPYGLVGLTSQLWQAHAAVRKVACISFSEAHNPKVQSDEQVKAPRHSEAKQISLKKLLPLS